MKEELTPEKFYSKSTHKKNLDLMKLLISYDKFQDDVKEIRDYMCITDGGISTEAESIKKWNKTIAKKDEEIRKSSIHEKESKEPNRKIPTNYITLMIDSLIEKYNLPKNFRYGLRKYIMFGEVSAPSNNFALVGRTDISEEWHEGIEIYAELSNDEVKFLKRYLDSFLGTKVPSVPTLKNINRDLEVERLAKDRKRFDPIEQKTYRMKDSEIAENTLNSRNENKKVYDILVGLEDQRYKRFEKFKEKDSENT